MKLHIHIKKLFDGQNRWLNLEKKLAKENANKVRGTATQDQISRSLGNRWHNPFGCIWWRGWRKRGLKNAQGQMLPQTRTGVQD